MSAADEVTEVYTLYGTNIVTSATACTLAVIYGSKIVLNLDSTLGTGLLTLHTADTAVGTELSCHSALIVVGALDYHTGGILDKVDNAVGTLSYADATADTLSGVNSCHTVLHGDSILGTSHSTVAVAETRVVTYLVTAVNHVCGETGLVSLVLKLSVGHVAGAVARNVSDLLDNVSRLDAEDSGDLLSGRVATGHAEVGGLGSLVGESLGVAVASGEATRTAVCTGEALTDGYSGLILLHRKEYCGEGEKYCTEERNTEKKKHGE